MAERPRRARRPQGRTVLEAVAVVVVLVGLTWSADAVARYGAETLLARNVRDAVGAQSDPVVEVAGRVFLPQVLRGAYDEVHVVTTGVVAGPLRIERVDATLTDVRVPFHDVLLRDVRAVGIGRSDQTAVLTYVDLNAYFEATGRPLRVSAGDAGRLRLSGRVDVLDQTVDVTAETRVEAADGRVILRPENVETSGDLNAATRLLLGQRLRLSVPLGTLPFGQQVGAITVGPESLTVTATGELVVVNP